MTALLYATPTITSFTSYLQYLNTITGGAFWTLVVLAIFAITFISLSVFSFRNAVVASTFVTFSLSVLLRAAGLVGDGIVGVLIVLLAFSGLWAYYSSKT